MPSRFPTILSFAGFIPLEIRSFRGVPHFLKQHSKFFDPAAKCFVTKFSTALPSLLPPNSAVTFQMQQSATRTTTKGILSFRDSP